MAQLHIFDALDAAGPHPHSVRLPRGEFMAMWRDGDAVPPGYLPLVAGEDDHPWPYSAHGDERDEQIAHEIWEAVRASVPQDVPFPFANIWETHRFPDGALWACMIAKDDDGLSHVTLRDGSLEWSPAPGAGMIIYAEDTRTWVRLPAKTAWDAEAQCWVPKSSAPAVAPPEVEVEAPEAAPVVAEAEAPVPAVIAPEPAAPVHVPTEVPPVSENPAADIHAIVLANDACWQRLVASTDRTTPADIHCAVRRHVLSGDLNVRNARSIMEAAGIAEPEDRSVPALRTMLHYMRDLGLGPDAWTAIHGVEDGWIFLRKTRSKLGDPVVAEITPEGLARIKVPAEAVAPDPEPLDVDPVDGTVPVPPAPADFMQRLLEKQAAARIARAAEFCPVRALAEAGLSEWSASRGTIRDPDAPAVPTDLACPVHLVRAAPYTGGGYSLTVPTPPCLDLPFVKRVEAITGLTARLAPSDLEWTQRRIAQEMVSDDMWERLVGLMPHTTIRAVERVSGWYVMRGLISAANARRLLERIGSVEPEDRSTPSLVRMTAAAGEAPDDVAYSTGWIAIHAVEDAWVVPGKADRSAAPRVTKLGAASARR